MKFIINEIYLKKKKKKNKTSFQQKIVTKNSYKITKQQVGKSSFLSFRFIFALIGNIDGVSKGLVFLVSRKDKSNELTE